MALKAKTTSRHVKLMSLLMIGLGIVGVLFTIFDSMHFNLPPDFGSRTGYIVLAIGGLFGLIVSSAISDLEDRIDRIEKSN